MQKMHLLFQAVCLMTCFSFGGEMVSGDRFSMEIELVPGTTDTIIVVGSWDVSDQDKPFIQGYVVGICHDGAVATVGDCVGSHFESHVEICSGGACANITCPSDVTDQRAYGFHHLTVYDNGITEAVIFDLMQTWGMPSQARFEIIQVKYDDVVGRSTVSICDTLGAPPVESLYIHDGNSIYPAIKGSVLIIGRSNEFLRGDTNADGVIDIADVVFLLTYLFNDDGDVPECLDASDANDNEKIDLSDAIRVLGFLFKDEADLPPPFPECGIDPTEDSLNCVASTCEE